MELRYVAELLISLRQRDRGRHDDCNGTDPARLDSHERHRAYRHDAFRRRQMKSVARTSYRQPHQPV
jgi:hypothetical protein